MSKRPKIGAFVLETLTTGMYTAPLDALREYVQNSFDAIRQAEREKLIRPGEGRIDIDIDSAGRSVRIRDNGVGISAATAVERLTDIGLSNKSLDTDVGFRGIGRLAGIAYCDALFFRTSAADEAEGATVLMSSSELRKAMCHRVREPRELSDVLSAHSAEERFEAKKSEHYFEVELSGVAESGADFLRGDLMEEYLSQVVPVAFDAQRFWYAKKITDWASNAGLELPQVTVIIRGDTERQVFKPYKNHYKTRHKGKEFPFDIEDVIFWPENPGPASPYWIWYGKTPLLGAILDEQAAGFRLRRSNMAIGTSEPARELFAATGVDALTPSNKRFNDWYVGEIHVQSPDVVPNARRDGFEDNAAWMSLKADLGTFFKQRVGETRALSRDRNRPTAKVIAAAKSTLDRTKRQLTSGLASKEQREELVEKVDKEEKKLTKALEARQSEADVELLEPIHRELLAVRETLERTDSFALKKLRSSLDRKQRNLLKRVLGILHNVLDEENFDKAQDAILSHFEVSEL
ncbi:MAG: ATP-binding protein [Candidatus Hydrogenedentes bacterium]|nr:ATP-binding protein [Candidatus Hydrogenedentota bacterium]